MTSHTFTLTEGNDFITLDTLLKLMRLVGSGGEAHAVIQEGMVEVNGVVELQKRKKIRAGDKVEFNGQHIEVVS
jgi:ribosome-associated protein